MKIRLTDKGDDQDLTGLIAGFRQALAELRGKAHGLDLAAAQAELAAYREKGYPVFAAEQDEALIGYLVCRVEGDVVWAESLYVVPAYRRQGAGTALYEQAERLAAASGSDTVYNWVDPRNTRIIRFLQKRGYNVLNLIEVRRAVPGEQMTAKINVGPHEFDHY